MAEKGNKNRSKWGLKKNIYQNNCLKHFGLDLEESF